MRDPWDRTTSFFADPQGSGEPSQPTQLPAAPMPAELRTGSGRSRRVRIAAVGVLATAATVAVLLPSTSATADPSGHVWHRLRTCESGNNYRTNTGNGHFGAYQFDQQTWDSVGGHGLPSNASHKEQDARALILYRERGWQPWQCASILGLREDSDAGSGFTGDIHIANGNNTSANPPKRSNPPKKSKPRSSGIAPAFPGGSHWYRYGETNSRIKVFQDRMHARGYFPVGTGQFGPNTLRMVKQLQRLNGLVPNGYLGPNTWRLAWIGRYSD
jgi:peptidoglycan hydrolase-like protein with peptidoglycan-binding domain